MVVFGTAELAIILVAIALAIAVIACVVRRKAKGGAPQDAGSNSAQQEAEGESEPPAAEDPAQAEAEALEAARREMALAQQEIHDVQVEFKHVHDDLVAGIYVLAKAGCDAEFRQRFGVTRPPKANRAEDDVEVQEFLRDHYAELRDVALEKATESLMADEVDRRVAAREAEAAAADAPGPERSGDAVEDAPDASTDANGNAEAWGAADEGTADGPSAEGESSPEAEAIPTGERLPAESANDDSPAIDRTPIEAAVRDEFDADSVRTYLLAAISARYDETGKPADALPWPAFTRFSSRGYGELALCAGAPLYVQDAYRAFAWKKFHTGKRAEKPVRGEYSWPASHGLGDGSVIYGLETPAGTFEATGPTGALPLCEWTDCAWMRHTLEYQGALLRPASQRSFFVNLEGLRKGDVVRFGFDAASFLAEADDSEFFVNAIGEANGACIGISVSNPPAAAPGEAPYEISERSGTGFAFRMANDARRYYADTYPQFIEVHIAWSQPPAPRPERIVRHVAY